MYSDETTGLQVLVKDSDEDRLYDFDFERADKLRPGDSIDVPLPTEQSTRGNVAGSTPLVIGGEAKSDTIIQVRIGGGTNLEDYTVEARAQTVQGDVLVFPGMIYVRDAIP